MADWTKKQDTTYFAYRNCTSEAKKNKGLMLKKGITVFKQMKQKSKQKYLYSYTNVVFKPKLFKSQRRLFYIGKGSNP
jgi:hypothetical protein